MGVKAERTPRVCHREWKKTPASLGYPPSVFNKNSTLKRPRCPNNKKTNKCWYLRHETALNVNTGGDQTWGISGRYSVAEDAACTGLA